MKVVTNLKSFIPRELKKISRETMVHELTAKLGSKEYTLMVFPDTPLTWDPATENNFISMFDNILHFIYCMSYMSNCKVVSTEITVKTT